MNNAITNIYKINLNVKKNEKVLVFTDDYDSKLINIARRIADKGKNYTPHIIYLKYKATESHGAEPPVSLWQAAFSENVVKKINTNKLLKPLLNKKADKKQINKVEDIIKKFKKNAVNVVIALSYYSTSHTKFRNFLTNICGTRYASMPLFDADMLRGAMKVDWEKLAQRTKESAQRIKKFNQIEIKTPNGTFMTLSKKGRKANADTGIITKKGAFSNLPAGEVFLAPVEGTAQGKLVLEWAPTHKLKKPITLYVEDGKVKKIEGSDTYAAFLKTKLSERYENSNIAELGIGTNDRASRPDNILESEKILGTIHIALGDNSTFGGKISTPFHQDFVFFKPTVTLINKKGEKHILINKGKLLNSS